jgi:RimJ/RimL family protein N-acetyltransferase
MPTRCAGSATARRSPRTHALTHLVATTAPENAASHRVLEKAGFRRGELRDNGDGTHTQLFHWACATSAP